MTPEQAAQLLDLVGATNDRLDLLHAVASDLLIAVRWVFTVGCIVVFTTGLQALKRG